MVPASMGLANPYEVPVGPGPAPEQDPTRLVQPFVRVRPLAGSHLPLLSKPYRIILTPVRAAGGESREKGAIIDSVAAPAWLIAVTDP